MRRIIIFFYWLFKDKHNVGFYELISFGLKPQVRKIAELYLTKIDTTNSFYEVEFNTIPQVLYWPKECSIDGIYQVTSETFDKNDWHYYQKAHTEVLQDEILLDIGAAEGLFALSVIERCKKVFLIEPNDYFVKALSKTFAPYQNKVAIINAAVGSETGEIVFNPDSLIGRVTTDNNQGVKKRLATIDELLGDAPITYLKADIEGFEEDMLKGAEKVIKQNKPKMAITVYHKENDTNQIISTIKSYVPEYQCYTKGISQTKGKPVMIHFWIS
jgi:FkbM family methyltransferase